MGQLLSGHAELERPTWPPLRRRQPAGSRRGRLSSAPGPTSDPTDPPERLRDAGREVFLACGRAAWQPRRIGDHDLFWWLVEAGELDEPLGSLPSPAARLAGNVQATGRGGGHDLEPFDADAPEHLNLSGFGAGLRGWLPAGLRVVGGCVAGAPSTSLAFPFSRTGPVPSLAGFTRWRALPSQAQVLAVAWRR
jgi:hypothetical protein